MRIKITLLRIMMVLCIGFQSVAITVHAQEQAFDTGNIKPADLADIDFQLGDRPPAALHMVIVNANNRYSANVSDMQKKVKLLFLKKIPSWPSGLAAIPVARPPGSKVQKAFQKNILSMSDAQMSRYWVKLKQRNGEVAPKAASSRRMAILSVAQKEGAFSVVENKGRTDLPKGVKVLFEF